MRFIILIHGKPMKPSNGSPYAFTSVMEAIRTVDMCYGLSALKDGVEIKMVDRHEVTLMQTETQS